MSAAPRSVGHIRKTAIRDMANAIKMRALGHRTGVVIVYVDAGEVFTVRDALPHPLVEIVGTYNRKASIGEIAADLMCVRDAELKLRRAA